MSITEKKVYTLSWEIVEDFISEQLSSILDKPIQCKASLDDADYWSVNIQNCRLTMAELNAVFERVGADEEMRIDTMAEGLSSFKNLGVSLSSRLLQMRLGYDWERIIADEKELWLVGCIKNDCLQIADKSIVLGHLKGKEELMEYLTKCGPTHTSLMDFCEEYRQKYHDELCWSYPISDGKHLGTFLVLVKEGILSLPYDDADKVDYESFNLEDACLFRKSEDMAEFIESWNQFSCDLQNVMTAFYHHLKKEEEKRDA